MNYLDIIFIAIALCFVFSGYRKGLVKSVGGILGLFVGAYFAGLFYPTVSSFIQGVASFLSQFESDIISFLLVFIITNRLFALVVVIVDKIVNIPIISFINRVFGAIFGLFGSVILVALVTMVLANIGSSLGDKNPVLNSKLIPHIDYAIKVVQPFLPSNFESVKDIVSNNANNLRNMVDEKPNVNVDDMTLDELIDYLNSDNKVPQSVIEKIKENEFKNQKNITAEMIKEKFNEYLNNVKEE
ncbi:MAG: CvpA family protein [Patescibacteria group bacterium]|nr:CvpA family protein [Patescibacteria group bacterium]MDD4304083.1 CvpA family protein [Patescibacteria group bacterium]MDD4694960.1 CvpA family protein [Patescibacteria group bacterium]